MQAPKVFVSYSHDSEDHKEWVRALATKMRGFGVDVVLDQWDLQPGQDLAMFMQNGIAESDRVLMVCSNEYVRKAEKGAGGVGYERLIVTGELVQQIDTIKFLPIVRANDARRLPNFLGPRLWIDFSDDQRYNSALEQLARAVLGAPLHERPPLGQNPFSGAASVVGGAPVLDNSVHRIERDIDDAWFHGLSQRGMAGLGVLECMGGVEYRIALQAQVLKSQRELFDAIRSSQITTFGWPIGVVLDKDPWRPYPTPDGIEAEISIRDDAMNGRPSYDLWAARQNGDFTTVQSYFEDSRESRVLYFNTRIVRAAETLMFYRRFCENLHIDPAAKALISVFHRGLTGRTIKAVGGNRHISSRITKANETNTKIEITIGEIESKLPEYVKDLMAPTFMMFEFFELGDTIYEDIVRKFQAGRVS